MACLKNVFNSTVSVEPPQHVPWELHTGHTPLQQVLKITQPHQHSQLAPPALTPGHSQLAPPALTPGHSQLAPPALTPGHSQLAPPALTSGHSQLAPPALTSKRTRALSASPPPELTPGHSQIAPHQNSPQGTLS